MGNWFSSSKNKEKDYSSSDEKSDEERSFKSSRDRPGTSMSPRFRSSKSSNSSQQNFQTTSWNRDEVKE